MKVYLLLAAGMVSACAQQQGETFVPSSRSAVEMRSIQSRSIEAPSPIVARGVVATLHDLGYYITRVDPGSGTISATKADALRLSAVIRPQADGRSVVRANALILAQPGRVMEVDAPAFYQQNFFAPLVATLGREAFAVPNGEAVPEPARPEPERRPESSPPAAGAAR